MSSDLELTIAGELGAQGGDHLGGLVDRERRLGDEGDLVGVGDLERLDFVGGFDQDDAVGRLAGRPFDLLVALVADHHDRVAVGGEAAGGDVDLGHQRAGGVDRAQAARGGVLVDGRGDAVGGEDDHLALGHLGLLLDEDRAALGELLDDVLVVDDLLAHVDRRAVELERALDRLHGAVDAGAVAARGGEQDPFRGRCGGRGHDSRVASAASLERWPPQGHHLDRLTAVDASFLTNETSASHMHVGAILIFEGPPPKYVDLVEHVRGRLDQVPRFRQRLVVPPLEAGRPLWADDVNFNLTYHIRHTGAARAGRRGAAEAARRRGSSRSSSTAPSRSGSCGWCRAWSATASRC